MSRLAPLTVIALLTTACGTGEPGPAATSTTSPAVTTSVAPSATTTAFPAPTSTAPETTTTEGTVERYEIIDGDFRGPESFIVRVGETFEIEVVSDAAGELHVHGYDLLFELAADEPSLIEVVASAPGVFEVELEGSHTHLFDIEVRG